MLLESFFAQESEFNPDHEVQARGLAAVINGLEVGDILVARKGGEIVGMVSLLYTVSTALGGRVALLEDMVVSPKARWAGTGSELMSHFVEPEKEKGCKRITLQPITVMKGRTVSINDMGLIALQWQYFAGCWMVNKGPYTYGSRLPRQ